MHGATAVYLRTAIHAVTYFTLHTEPVYSTLRVRQRVARVYLKQLILILVVGIQYTVVCHSRITTSPEYA